MSDEEVHKSISTNYSNCMGVKLRGKKTPARHKNKATLQWRLRHVYSRQWRLWQTMASIKEGVGLGHPAVSGLIDSAARTVTPSDMTRFCQSSRLWSHKLITIQPGSWLDVLRLYSHFIPVQ